MTVQIGTSFNTIKKGFKWDEGETLDKERFFSIDGRLKYDLNELLGDTKKFDPFVLAGIGYSDTNLKDMKIIAGYGFNYWFTDVLGLNFESTYNHNFKNTFTPQKGTGTDYFQHAIGLAYHFGIPKKNNDTDGDGIENKKDKCPEQFGIIALDGCPEPKIERKDTDNDGLFDDEDKCPLVPGIKELKGCPAKDSDGDGIPDHLDKCPEIKGIVSNDGCEEILEIPEVESALEAAKPIINELKDLIIYFDFDSTTLDKVEIGKLNKIALLVNQLDPIYTFIIEGNTDARGSEEYNFELSLKRCNAVMKYLTVKGVNKERMIVSPLGKFNPKTQDNNALNRRVEIKVR